MIRSMALALAAAPLALTDWSFAMPMLEAVLDFVEAILNRTSARYPRPAPRYNYGQYEQDFSYDQPPRPSQAQPPAYARVGEVRQAPPLDRSVWLPPNYQPTPWYGR